MILHIIASFVFISFVGGGQTCDFPTALNMSLRNKILVFAKIKNAKLKSQNQLNNELLGEKKAREFC